VPWTDFGHGAGRNDTPAHQPFSRPLIGIRPLQPACSSHPTPQPHDHRTWGRAPLYPFHQGEQDLTGRKLPGAVGHGVRSRRADPSLRLQNFSLTSSIVQTPFTWDCYVPITAHE